MYLKSLYLHNFRLYAEAYFEFSPHINVICGENGAGKTSLLEAISLLGLGHSFRTHHTAHLIRHAESHFYLEAHFVKYGIEHQLKICYSPREKKILLNNTRCPSASSLYGIMLNVVLSPADLDLIGGSPQGRRHFLDAHLSQINPLYLHHLVRYSRAMRQRNHLLKSKVLLSIESWEHEMAFSATYLLKQRRLLIDALQVYARELYGQISQGAALLTLALKPSGKPPVCAEQIFPYYLEQYRKHRPREMIFAATLYGPHRDDLDLSLNSQEARLFASEGEKRSIVAALRFAEWLQLQQSTGEIPLMLIDEVSATLDQCRYNNLLAQFECFSQVFVTATDPPLFSALTKEKKEIFCKKPA